MRALLLPLLATLACSLLTPAGSGPTVAATAPAAATQALPPPGTPAPAAAPAYTGQFDCYGAEGGLGAYAGRITIQPAGLVTFKDYDGLVQSGAWTYDAAARAFTFTGGTPLARAVYQPADDTLAATRVANAQVVHAEGGRLRCQRARPGITGPP